MEAKNMIGQVCGRLTVTQRAPNNASKQAQWYCKCSCGNSCIVTGHSLRNGHTASCGCLLDEWRKQNSGKNHKNWQGGDTPGQLPWANQMLYNLTRNAKFKKHATPIGTAQEVVALWVDSKQICGICKIHENECTRRHALDHDHYTGELRGFLCGNCNTALGLLQDSPELLQAAIEYLSAPVLA